MKKAGELDVRGTVVRVVKIGDEDYICLTEIRNQAGLKKLNEIAIQQMRILSEVEGRKYLK